MSALDSGAGSNRISATALLRHASSAQRTSSMSDGRKPVFPTPSAMKYVIGDPATPARPGCAGRALARVTASATTRLPAAIAAAARRTVGRPISGDDTAEEGMRRAVALSKLHPAAQESHVGVRVVGLPRAKSVRRADAERDVVRAALREHDRFLFARSEIDLLALAVEFERHPVRHRRVPEE